MEIHNQIIIFIINYKQYIKFNKYKRCKSQLVFILFKLNKYKYC